MLRFIKLSDTGFLPLLPISIHLMLRFIGIFTVCFPIPDAISIHLMLRFISFDPAVKSCLNYFNTSHVTVYHFMDIKDFTVMLEFQYISCYGLSNIRCCKRMPKQNFNTSHGRPENLPACICGAALQQTWSGKMACWRIGRSKIRCTGNIR